MSGSKGVDDVGNPYTYGCPDDFVHLHHCALTFAGASSRAYSSLSVYFGMAHGKVGAASCSKQKIQIFTRCLYRGGSRLCAVYVLSATLPPEARSTVHSS